MAELFVLFLNHQCNQPTINQILHLSYSWVPPGLFNPLKFMSLFYFTWYLLRLKLNCKAFLPLFVLPISQMKNGYTVGNSVSKLQSRLAILYLLILLNLSISLRCVVAFYLFYTIFLSFLGPVPAKFTCMQHNFWKRKQGSHPHWECALQTWC